MVKVTNWGFVPQGLVHHSPPLTKVGRFEGEVVMCTETDLSLLYGWCCGERSTLKKGEEDTNTWKILLIKFN